MVRNSMICTINPRSLPFSRSVSSRPRAGLLVRIEKQLDDVASNLFNLDVHSTSFASEPAFIFSLFFRLVAGTDAVAADR